MVRTQGSPYAPPDLAAHFSLTGGSGPVGGGWSGSQGTVSCRRGKEKTRKSGWLPTGLRGEFLLFQEYIGTDNSSRFFPIAPLNVAQWNICGSWLKRGMVKLSWDQKRTCEHWALAPGLRLEWETCVKAIVEQQVPHVDPHNDPLPLPSQQMFQPFQTPTTSHRFSNYRTSCGNNPCQLV